MDGGRSNPGAVGPDETVRAFLDAAAAATPTPGGGAVAALAGALAAAMGEMVLNYSVNKRDLSAHRDALAGGLHELQNARRLLLALVVEDQLAFAALGAAKKRQPADQQAVRAALLVCVRVPQAIGASAVAILAVAERVAPIANRYLLSDLAVCGELAMATLRSAAHNVRINLGDVSDSAERLDLRASTEKMVTHGTDAIRRLMPAIWKRIEAAAPA